MNSAIESWLPLKQGNQAPDFKAFDRTGNLVNLSDLQGKKVYVDVWATWCGPCIREIPSLKELEHELGDDIEFCECVYRRRRRQAKSGWTSYWKKI